VQDAWAAAVKHAKANNPGPRRPTSTTRSCIRPRGNASG
jgi:hypothetical protein